MKTKSFKLVSLILSALMLLSVCTAFSASAQVTSGADQNITWEYDSDTYTLTINGTGDYPDYEYPNLEPWFDLCAHDVKHLVIGEGITDIPARAFQTAYFDLETVKLPDSLIAIGEGAFGMLDYLYEVDFGSGVAEIGPNAFEYTDLRSVRLPDSLVKIWPAAFSNCEYLKEVDLGNGVETIGERAFTDTAVKYVTIPDSVKTIGKYAFGYTFYEDDNDEGAYYSIYKPAKAFEIYASATGAGADYAKANGFTLCTGAASISPTSVSMTAGSTKTLKVKNAAVSRWASTDSKVATVRDGKVYALKKGSCKIVAETVSGKRLVSKVTVTNSPKLTIAGKAYKKGATYSVKKGSCITVKISGKSSLIKNVYATSNNKIAKVVSKTTASTVKVKGYKKGTATIKITVNKIVYTFKVKVK